MPIAASACGTCLERCPPEALTLGDEDPPEVNLDRCFGCAVCATGCPSEAISMVNKPGFPAPPKDGKALREAVNASTDLKKGNFRKEAYHGRMEEDDLRNVRYPLRP